MNPVELRESAIDATRLAVRLWVNAHPAAMERRIASGSAASTSNEWLHFAERIWREVTGL